MVPLHELPLRIGSLLVLLRNYNPSKGLCAGTHLIVHAFHAKLWSVRIANGPLQGSNEALPRIMCTSSIEDLPFNLNRRQYTNQFAGAVTINRWHGQQNRQRFGLYLPRPVWMHGQLYVALSRATSSRGVNVLAVPVPNKQLVTREGTFVLSVVDYTLLELASADKRTVDSSVVLTETVHSSGR